ncbi:AraC family transcriptional regulator [Maricurvus nonylphenolicus]|uniref:AraC family transcriptional regulator n=1 Tax=Maricurvus nonylphenolicus TaxID=1008307 RepID=UPI0036F4064B
MDELSALLQDLDFNAEVFFSGSLCGLEVFEEQENTGSLHMLKSGSMTMITEQGHQLTVDKPAVIFLPSGSQHRIQIKELTEAELVCANIQFQTRQKTTLVDSLPKFLCIDIEQDEVINTAAQSIFDEAFNREHGRHLMINRLCDIFILHILRYVIRTGIVELGMLAANTHPQLAKLMQALTANPEQPWAVETMAESVAMSRSKFAALFKDSLGQAPMEYLTDLRLNKAKQLLTQDKPVAVVANAVGYDSPSSLSRVFKQRFGITPKQWLKDQVGG